MKTYNASNNTLFVFVCIIIVVVLFGCGKDSTEPNPREEKEEKVIPILPTLYITTSNKEAVTSKDEWLKGASIILAGSDLKSVDLGMASIKGRGNTTWTYPKKPYAIKMNEKVEMLGLPKEKRFNLLADYIDRTHLRNAVSFEIARRAKGLEWTPKGTHINLNFNGKDMGLYFFCEHIKISKNRVNLKDKGYILELDVYYDEDFKFRSSLLNLPVQLKDPDPEDLTDADKQEIKDFFNAAEDAVVNGGNWREFIDEDSFVDWWIVMELAECGEPGHPKSSYMYRDKGGKLKAGPVWDFDWGTYWSHDIRRFRDKEAIFYKYLFNDPAFVAKVKERWNASKQDFFSVTDFIDETAERIRYWVSNDNSLWPMTTNINGDESLSFDGAVNLMKTNYKNHWEWMDWAINAM